MDEYFQKYAKPLGKLSMFDLRNNLNLWRQILKDELESILYGRNALNFNNNNLNNSKFNKFLIKIFLNLRS